MARPAVLTLLLLGLLGAALHAQENGFDLADALGDDDKKPTLPPKKPSDGNDFNLEDALGGRGHDDPASPNQPKPKPKPNPNQPGTSGGFSDTDLLDGTSGNEGHGGDADDGRHRNEGQETNSQGVVPGIVGAVVVAVAGAISSFIAYQKKKLCFKENAEQGEVDLENRAGTNAEPPVQRTLLEK